MVEHLLATQTAWIRFSLEPVFLFILFFARQFHTIEWLCGIRPACRADGLSSALNLNYICISDLSLFFGHGQDDDLPLPTKDAVTDADTGIFAKRAL